MLKRMIKRIFRAMGAFIILRFVLIGMSLGLVKIKPRRRYIAKRTQTEKNEKKEATGDREDYSKLF